MKDSNKGNQIILIPIAVALIGLVGAITSAIIAANAQRMTTQIPIQATQTAEATLASLPQTVIAISTPPNSTDTPATLPSNPAQSTPPLAIDPLSPTPNLEEPLTQPPDSEEPEAQQPISAACGSPHPKISGTTMGGDVTIVSPLPTGECLQWNGELFPIYISWKGISPPNDKLWLLVYSPLAQRYFPHVCHEELTSAGGQSCTAGLEKLEPYDVIVILADATAHQSLKDNNSGMTPEELPDDISEKGSILVVRIK